MKVTIYQDRNAAIDVYDKIAYVVKGDSLTQLLRKNEQKGYQAEVIIRNDQVARLVIEEE